MFFFFSFLGCDDRLQSLLTEMQEKAQEHQEALEAKQQEIDTLAEKEKV